MVNPRPGGVHRAKTKVAVKPLMQEDLFETEQHWWAGILTPAQILARANAAYANAQNNRVSINEYTREKRKLDHYRANNKAPSKAETRLKRLEPDDAYHDPAKHFPPWHDPDVTVPVEEEAAEDVGIASNIDATQAAGAQAAWVVSNWEHGKVLGAGGFGHANLYVQRDMRGNIRQRMVVKRSPMVWEIQREYHIHKRLARANWSQGTKQVPDIIGNSRSVLNPHYAVIRQEYAAHGTLWQLCEWYKEIKRIIPEPFIWHVFWSLIKACLVMHDGCDDPAQRDPVQTNTWTRAIGSIVHFDTKPNNVFMANGETRVGLRFPWTAEYPRILLADFGLSREYIPNDPSNPVDARVTNPGWNAPEQFLQAYRGGFPHFIAAGGPPPPHGRRHLTPGANRLTGAHTNVWCIANVVYHLMRPDLMDRHIRTHHRNPFFQRHELYPNGFLPARYSPELTDLVFDCMRFSPSARPSLDAVYNRVEQAMLRLNAVNWATRAIPRLVYPRELWPQGGQVFIGNDYKIPIDRAAVRRRRRR